MIDRKWLRLRAIFSKPLYQPQAGRYDHRLLDQARVPSHNLSSGLRAESEDLGLSAELRSLDPSNAGRWIYIYIYICIYLSIYIYIYAYTHILYG